MLANLFEMYRRAEYVVREPRVVIRIGEASPALDALIGAAGSAAFITAANPGSERLGDEENARLLAALAKELQASGMRHLEGEGRDPNGAWPPERSFLVLGIARGEATALARRFAQNAFVWCEKAGAPELVVTVKWRLVLDTQVWLDWLAFDDPCVAGLKAAVNEGRAEIYMDAPCEAELERVLGYRLSGQVAGQELRAARLAAAKRLARAPGGTIREAERGALPRCRDPHDQKFLELAAAARAHVLVTKDRALLELAARLPFRIVPPAGLDLG